MDRQQHWEKIYGTRSYDDVSWYQPNPLTSLALLEQAAISTQRSVIDVGAGASFFVDRMLEKGFADITVVDISSSALKLVEERLGEQGKNVTFHVEDVTKLNLEHCFDFWHDRAVFHFLTDVNDRIAYLDVLDSHLADAGSAVIAAFGPDGPTMCSGLEIVQYDEQRIAETLGDRFRVIEVVSEQHRTPADKLQAFNFFRIVRNINAKPRSGG